MLCEDVPVSAVLCLPACLRVRRSVTSGQVSYGKASIHHICYHAGNALVLHTGCREPITQE